ncbi:MAG: preprotein translocase subunit SecA [Deltaproteobacteria bacterium]|nr:preprotein translocase subunit SecA [Deltaproteobacteria bacterium]
MFQWLICKIIGTKNERELKKLKPLVFHINAFEPQIKKLSDAGLKAKTAEFRERVQKGESLDALLPEAFAVVREAAVRALGQRHFDAQLLGGLVLHQGKIAEMKTGEGKTLVATLPVYLNSLSGKGVHVVTVNDYLARRDAEWMGQIYKFLGLSVGCIVHGLSDSERQWAYKADVTYGTNNEFGFDYLRDNMKYDLADYVQRDLNYAIVDEVDSILVDEARTPLIISGPAEESTHLYYSIDRIIPFLKKETHFTLDEKSKSVMLSEEGVAEVEKKLNVKNLYDPRNINFVHHVNQALRAHAMYKRDVDYVVKDGKVLIVDEFTGRLMPGRRWSDGLHQAVEAKEGVQIENENQTLASVTFQNYFRMYAKLAGMTGTAETEAPEFAKIYNLDVMVIPTNLPMVREDYADVIYKTEPEKFRAVIKEIEECHAKGQPVLVGTISIEKSEKLAEMLSRRGIKHHVLNAKQHEKEAAIVAQAGRKAAVTISTNMAGRGTDIMLGGNPEFMAREQAGRDAPEEDFKKAVEAFRQQCQKEKEEVKQAGGLHILGTERHESRRIDNQLRGRSGRQGDAGTSRFYLSLDDDLLRIFGGERIQKMMERFGLEEDEPIEHPWLSRAIANAQKKVEAHNFSIRKSLLEFDDVMNQQRRTIYKRRREILGAAGTKDFILDMADEKVTELAEEWIPEKFDPEAFDPAPLEEKVREVFDLSFDAKKIRKKDWSQETIGKTLYESLVVAYEEKRSRYPEEVFFRIEKFLLLSTLDGLWKDHLLQMDHLREGIGLRGYGQKDPLLEYKREGFGLFRQMMGQLTTDVLQKLFRVRIQEEQVARASQEVANLPFKHQPMQMSHQETGSFRQPAPSSPLAAGPQTTGSTAPSYPKVGRNDPCPCGSGRKYKKCHGG